MSSPSGGATPTAGAGPSRPPRRLPPKLLDDAARRIATLALFLVVVVVLVQVFQRLAQPQLLPVIDDPVNRLVTLANVLLGVALFVVHRYGLVTSRTILVSGMVFAVFTSLAISMIT